MLRQKSSKLPNACKEFRSNQSFGDVTYIRPCAQPTTELGSAHKKSVTCLTQNWPPYFHCLARILQINQ